jgi:hypothetical protein
MRASLTAIALLLVIAACGPVGGGSGTSAPTASSVALKLGDLPSGMHRCDISGDINAYLKKIQTSDPTTYASTKAHWDAAQKGGATAADVELYTDSTAHCTNLATNGSQIGSATYKLAVDFVFQFKDEASAATGYSSDSIFGFSVASLKSSVLPTTEGTATGLGKTSIVLSFALSDQAVYLAVWQNKQFMSILGVFNIDAATDKKIAQAVNGRIH